jgi:hypothetical protein
MLTLVKAIGNFIFVRDIDMPKQVVQEFTTIEVLDLCCPETPPTYTQGKGRKSKRVQDQRSRLWAELSQHNSKRKNEIFMLSTEILVEKWEKASEISKPRHER